MKNISKMTGEELGKVLWDLFGGDDREFLENCGYVEDNLSDHYDRADIAAITPEAWAAAWDSYDRRRGGATMGRKGGKSKSDAKTTAARENGKRGGRPRTNKVQVIDRLSGKRVVSEHRTWTLAEQAMHKRGGGERYALQVKFEDLPEPPR